MIEKDFVKEGLKRTRIDEYLETKLERAGYGGMDIQVTPVGTMVIVYAEKPGMVIGRGGKTVRSITKTLKNNFELENPQVEVKEVEVPELNPRIMAHKCVAMLQRGMQFRRVAYSIIRRIMSSGAQGVEVTISGKIRGSRSACAKFNDGYIKKCGEPSIKHVKEGFATVQLKPGVLGIYVRIMPPEVILPDNVEISERDFTEEPVEEVQEEIEENNDIEIQEEITGEDILEELSEEAETEEITEETNVFEQHVKVFEEEIIPKIEESIDSLTSEEEGIVDKLQNVEELSFLDPSKFSELKEKVKDIHFKLHNEDE